MKLVKNEIRPDKIGHYTIIDIAEGLPLVTFYKLFPEKVVTVSGGGVTEIGISAE